LTPHVGAGLPSDGDVVISGHGLRLRRISGDDADFVVRWRNDPEIARWFFSVGQVTPESHREWCRKNRVSTQDYTFVILSPADEATPIGMAALYDVDYNRRIAEFGRIFVGPPTYRGMGLARRASLVVLDFGFNRLELSDIYLDVLKGNERAIALYEGLGFACASNVGPLPVRDGVLRMKISSGELRTSVA
jgi:RimJ/RimL family protein N-acetyltransferase